jgi:hypothetical protein
VPDEQYLLNEQQLIVAGKGIETDDLRLFMRQQPNSTIARMRFNLWLYNFNNPDKNRWIDRKLRSLGEAPVIYDSIQTELSALRINDYIASRGYYNSTVNLNVKKQKKKADVYYRVKIADRPYTIRNVAFEVRDSLLDTTLICDSAKAVLHSGSILDEYLFEREKDRIVKEMRNNGYFRFNKNYVTFDADSSVGDKQTDVIIVVHKETVDPIRNVQRSHRLFTVDKVIVNADYDAEKAVNDTVYRDGWDTVRVIADYSEYGARGLRQIYKK